MQRPLRHGGLQAAVPLWQQGLLQKLFIWQDLFTVYCELEEHGVWLGFVCNHVHWGTMPEGCWAAVTVELPLKVDFPANSTMSHIHRKKRCTKVWSFVNTVLTDWVMYRTKCLLQFVFHAKADKAKNLVLHPGATLAFTWSHVPGSLSF